MRAGATRALPAGVLAALLAACSTLAPAPGGTPARAPAAPAAGAAAPASAVRFERDASALALDIRDADWLAAWPAWMASCRALTDDRAAHRSAWEPVCTEAIFLAPRSGRAVREFLLAHLDRYRVLAAGAEAGARPDAGLVTGYYEPVLEGSRRRSGDFVAPVYRAPAPGTALARAELDAGGQLQGLELLWLRDPIEAFFLEVQGSGRIHLDDGSWIRVAYAASNGLPYRSIGRWLVEQGELPAEQVSAAAIRDWAHAHPQKLRTLLEQNPRVVFFREVPLGDPAQGPIGSLGVALTPGYSVAVDPRFLPLGAPLLLDTQAPCGKEALTRLALAQDTGGAIRGPLRIDWFWGLGDAAGELAGHQHGSASVQLLVPRGVDPQSLLSAPSAP